MSALRPRPRDEFVPPGRSHFARAGRARAGNCQTGMEDFFTDALASAYDLTSYHVSRRLAELFPGKTVLEGDDDAFNLEAYARAGLCEIVSEARPHAQALTEWDGPGRPLKRDPLNAWINVLWRGRLLDVVFMHFTEAGCWMRHYWIISDERAAAEEFFRAVCDWCAEVRGEILVFEDGYWEKSEELFKSVRGATFDNLVLPDALRAEIERELPGFFAAREMYETYGVPWKRGVLLHGPPGNGKTHAVKAMVNASGLPCLYVKSLDGAYGTEHGRLRSVFDRARQVAPCVLVLEDLDSLVDDDNRSFFLNELDGFEANTGLAVLATTNHPERLDPALLDRPSRFDRKYHFDLPAGAERARFVAAWGGRLREEMRLSREAEEALVKLTEGFSFAYLKELFLSSMMQWMEARVRGGMDGIALARAEILREQTARAAEAAAEGEARAKAGAAA